MFGVILKGFLSCCRTVLTYSESVGSFFQDRIKLICGKKEKYCFVCVSYLLIVYNQFIETSIFRTPKSDLFFYLLDLQAQILTRV